VKVRVYDATLSEGTRGAGVEFGTRDRLRVALRLGDLGVAATAARRVSRSEVSRTARQSPSRPRRSISRRMPP